MVPFQMSSRLETHAEEAVPSGTRSSCDKKRPNHMITFKAAWTCIGHVHCGPVAAPVTGGSAGDMSSAYREALPVRPMVTTVGTCCVTGCLRGNEGLDGN